MAGLTRGRPQWGEKLVLPLKPRLIF